MTNEELAVRIQSGQRELIPQLWEQTKGFVKLSAKKYYTTAVVSRDNVGCELEDLIQEGFFALLNSIKCFKPESGYTFLTFMKLPLREAFSRVMGTRREWDRRKLEHSAISLEAPAISNGDVTLLDIVSKRTTSEDTYDEDAGIRSVYQRQLHSALEKSLALLTERQENVIRDRYYKGLTQKEIADMTGCLSSTISTLESNALQKMYSTRLQTGLDQYVNERTNYYQKIGITRFRTTWISAVENIVLQRNDLAESWLKSRKRKTQKEK